MSVGLLLVCYKLFELWLMHFGQLPEAGYEHPIIFVGFMKHIGIAWWVVLVAIITGIVRWGQPGRGWDSMDGARAIRVLVVGAAGILGWTHSTYEYNHFFDQGHYLDRALLVLCVPLIGWRPIFVLPFLGLVVPILWQGQHPLGLLLWAFDGVLVRVLMLFVTWFLLLGVTGRRLTTPFIFLVCCLVGSQYWVPGLHKLKLNWVTHGNIHFLLYNAYANGWLIGIDPETIVAVGTRLGSVDWVLRLSTLVIECGALIFLFRRWTLLIWIAGWIGFHVGVFALMGYCFWKWGAVDLFLAGIFLSKRWRDAWPIFDRRHFAMAIVIIGTGMIWFRPAALAWYDTRVNYVYEFEVTGRGGGRYMLPSSFFGVYTEQFTMGTFDFMSHDRHLVEPYGVTIRRPIADALLDVHSPQEVMGLESTMGFVRYDEEREAIFHDFLQRYITSWNARGARASWFAKFSAPPFLWNAPRGDPYQPGDPIERVTIYGSTWLYDGQRIHPIRRRVLGQVEAGGRGDG